MATVAGNTHYDIDDLKAVAERDPEAAYIAVGYPGDLQLNGNNLVGLCPFHDEQGPSFTIFPDGRFKCFGCGASGSVIDFFLRLEYNAENPGPEDLTRDAVAELARRLGVAPRPAVDLDWTMDDVDLSAVEQLAMARGWLPDAIRALGGREDGDFVVWPMKDAEGRQVGRKRRRADNALITLAGGGTTKSQSLDGNALIYPDDLAHLPDPVLLTEGEADAVAAISAGHQAVVATAGASARRKSEQWLQALLKGRSVVVVPDPDAAGRAWRDRLTRLLRNAGCEVRLLIADGDRDLDDRLRRAGDGTAELVALMEAAEPYEPPDEAAELSVFSDDDGKLIYPRIAEHLRRQAPVFGLRDRLYRYVGGVYRPDGEARIRAQLSGLLRERHSVHARREVVGYLLNRFPLLPDGHQNATDFLDPDPHLLNVANGLLDVTDLTLRPHDPEYLSTLQVPHEFDADADCPRIDRFLNEVFPDDAVPLAYEFVGTILRRDLNTERVLLLLGEGENGKSMFIQMLQALVGAHNYSAITAQQLDEGRFYAINLLGKLANFCADLPATTLRETSTFKRAVSRDPIEGEWKGVQPITFTPFAKFVFSCNQIPSTRDHSHAFYRRWMPIEFPHKFVDPAGYDEAFSPADHRPARPREELLVELTDPGELRGLLARALHAAQDVAERGGRYSEPQSVEAAQKRFRRETDNVAWFADECLFRDENATVARQQVYNVYTRWAEAQGLTAEPQYDFNKRLEDLGAKRYRPRTNDGRVKAWRGIGVIPDEAPSQEF